MCAVVAVLFVATATGCVRSSDRSTVVAAVSSTTPAAQRNQSGAGSQAAAVPGTGDPCALMTPGEAGSALGVDAGTSQSHPPVCEYPTGRGRLLLTVNQDRAADRYDFLQQEFRRRDVQGVGDRAFIGNGTIFVLKGSVLLQITFDTTDRPGATKVSDNALVALAKAAVKRI